MKLLSELQTYGAPICVASLSWALRWRGATTEDYSTAVRHLPTGEFGPTRQEEDQSFLFPLESNSAFVLLGERVIYVVDVVASDSEDPLPAIWNEIEILGERVAHAHFNHSLLVFSLSTDMSRELATYSGLQDPSVARPERPFFLFPAAPQGYEVYYKEVMTGPVHFRVIALQPADPPE